MSFWFLKDYREKHPEVTVLDPPDAIQHLLNRQSMLQDVADLNLSDSYGNLRNIFIYSNINGYKTHTGEIPSKDF